MFNAVLIANRGEIALRVIRACRELGVRTVAVHSEADTDAPHTRAADESHLLGPTPAAQSYLDIERILAVAADADVDAIHPGYGFLSENAEFARAVNDAGLTWIGPPPAAIERMGDKLSARAVASAAGVPVVPGTTEPTDDPDVAIAFGNEHGWPVAVKAMFGGGGRGLKVVDGPDQMRAALDAARREATASFGRGECYLERYLARPRHIEVQVLGDLDGTIIHLGERDCSLQRRHQKLVEEAPAPGLSDDVRARLGRAAIDVAREMGYHNAGTCEFLLDTDGTTFYFLEMNTRLQVEHPVTELVTGIDLVHQQLQVAAGDGMTVTQDDVALRGSAIELRVNAEDPAAGFVPSPGTITGWTPPDGPWVRLDAVGEAGHEITPAYDSLVGKLIVWGPTRDIARARMVRAIDEMVVTGIPTTLEFGRMAVQHSQFAAGEHATSSVEHEWDLSDLTPHDPARDHTRGQDASIGSAVSTSSDLTVRDVQLSVQGRRMHVSVYGHDHVPPQEVARPPTRHDDTNRAAADGRAGPDLVSPMQGTVIQVAIEPGAALTAGDLVCVVEAMKMENNVVAHRDGVVTDIGVEAGAVVEQGAVLARIVATSDTDTPDTAEAGAPGDAADGASEDAA